MEEDQGKHFGIKDQFIRANKFEQLTEKSKRGAIAYDNFCQSLQTYYLNYKCLYDNLYESVKVNPHEKSPFVKEFKQSMNNFTSMLKDVSVFQVDCLTQIRAVREGQLDNATEVLLDKLQQIKSPQDAFRNRRTSFAELVQTVKVSNCEMSRMMKDPSMFYNHKLIEGKRLGLQEMVEKLTELDTELTNEIKTVSENSKDYQKYIMHYRKQLFINKYHYLNKLFDMSKSAKVSLTQLLVLLHESVNNGYNTFHRMTKSESNFKYRLKRSNKGNQHQDNVASQIITMTQEYNFMIEEVADILSILVDTLANMGKAGNAEYQKSKSTFLEHLNKLYEIEESPTASVMDSLDLLNYFTQKLAGTSDKLFICSEELAKLKQNVKKHSDITLSLLKCAPSKTKVLQPQNHNTQSPRQYNKLDDLMEQMSLDFINAILQKVYKIFLEVFSELKNYFNSKYYTKRKHHVEDSMEISHIEEDFHISCKKPAKIQYWLWKDWKDYSLQVQFPFPLVKEVQDNLKGIKFSQDSGKQVQKYTCVLSTKKDHKGILKIMEKELHFGSSDGSLNLRIPLAHIQGAQVRVRIFQKVIVMNTSAGDITLSKFMMDVKEVLQVLQRQIEETGASSAVTTKPKRVPSALTPEEEKNMSEWRKKVVSNLQNLEDLIKIDQKTIEGTTIDHVYQMIYSDKPVNIKGKEFSSLYTYILTKNKNINAKSTDYAPIGPKFYTGNQSVTFQNSPIFSQRLVQYDIPLPPIPFMPKYCHCKEQVKIYWISNEAFDCVTTARQSGAPYTENLEVKILNRVRKGENGAITIEVLGKIFVLKDFSMRSMIQNKAKEQMNLNCKLTLEEQRKYMLNLISIKSGILEDCCEDQRSTQVSDNLIQTDSNSKMDKLKLQNKALMAGFAILIIANIIFNMFFDD